MKTKQKKIAYLVGIKGVAMTSLAVYLKEKGFRVLGSDVTETFSTDTILKNEKIKVLKGFLAENIKKNYNVVIVTGAHGGATNIEARQADNYSIPRYMHGSFLGKILNDKIGIAVAGCHGKTTTSSMIAMILSNAGLDPSYAIGTAYINELGPAGHYGRGKYFIAEADEYMTCPLTDKTPRFLHLYPKIAVITNIEFDHPDFYKSIEEVKNAYIDFSKNISKNGILITSIDDPGVSSVLSKFRSPRIITYGFSPRADFRIEKFYQTEFASFMQVVNKNLTVGEFMVSVPGKHNLLNALAALIAAKEIGLSEDRIKSLLKNYKGCNRRFELIGNYKNTALFDDYAHHPSEIKATLRAFKDRFPNKQIIVIFQPHTFSRTKELENLFASSFIDSNYTLVTDIFPSAREKYDPTINSVKLVSSINNIKNNAFYVSGIAQTVQILKKNLSENSIIVTMGAGDLYRWHSSLIDYLKTL